MSFQISSKMEDATMTQRLQFSSDTITAGTGSTSLSMKDLRNRTISFSLEDAVIIDSVFPLIDSDSGQVILGGLLDRNSSLFDGVQLAALVIDQPDADSGGINSQTHVSLECDSITDNTGLLTYPQTASTSDYYTGNLLTCLDQELSRMVVKQTDIQSINQPSVLLTFTTSTPEESATVNGHPSAVTSSYNLFDSGEAPSSLQTTSEPRESPQIISKASTTIPESPVKKGPYRCPTCPKLFTNLLPFKRHKQEHLNEKPFACKVCSSSFNFEVNLQLHEMLHEAETTGCLQCQVCPVKFSRLASLKNHLRVHEEDEMCVCQECGDEFSTMAMLKSHLEGHDTTIQREHLCKICHKTFSDASSLKDHSNEHTIARKHMKSLNTKHKRSRYKRISTIRTVPQGSPNSASQFSTIDNKKKRLCSVCGKRFEKPSQLTRHMRIHTGEKPFKCSQCGKSFNQKGTLESHIMSMHEKARPFICNMCNCTFSQRGNLRAHVKKVHVPPGENEKAFKCEECCCVFRKLATLNNHIARIHTVSQNIPSQADEMSYNTSLQPSTVMGDENVTGLSTYAFSQFNTENVSSLASQTTSRPIMSSDINVGTTTSGLAATTHISNLKDDSISEVKFAQGEEGASEVCVVKVKKVGQDRWHLCTYCPKTFRKPSDLIRHLRTHTLEKPYKCNYCLKAFAVKSTLNTHLLTHSSEKKWKCRLCLKAFTMLASLKTHERLHSNNKPFKCTHEGCEKHFKTSSQRRSHMKVHTRNMQGLSGKRRLLRIGETKKKIDYPDALKITPDGLVPVPTRCALSSTAKYPADAKSRPHRCSKCPSAFKKSSHLKQHFLTHTGEKPFQCFQCGRRFVSSGVLKNHIKTHQGVRPYKCEVCHLSFTTSGSLKRHTATHSTSRLYLCPFCTKTFKTNVSCRKHIKIHCNKGDFVALNDKDGAKVQNNLGIKKRELGKSNGDLGKIKLNQASSYNNSKFPITIKVSTSNTQPSNVEPVTVSKVKVPVMEDTSGNSDVFLNNMDIFSTIINSDVMPPETQRVDILNSFNPAPKQVNIASQTLEASPIVNSFCDYVPFQNMATTSFVNTLGNQNLNESTQIIYNIPLNSDNVVAPVKKVHQGNLPAKIIEVNSSQMKSGNSGSLNRVAVTKLQSIPTTNQREQYIKVKNTTTTVTNSENSTISPPKPVKHHSLKGDQPIILKTESISMEVLADRSFASASSKKIINENPAPFAQLNNDTGKHNKVPLQNHVKHTKIALKGKVKKTIKVNQCHLCERVFKKQSDLVRHIRIHTGEKPFWCDLCNKSFRVKSTRDAHLRIHEGRKTVACDICHNLFATISSLKVHMRLHTGAKPYKCTLCERTFRTTGHLQAHFKSHANSHKPRRGKTATLVHQNLSTNHGTIKADVNDFPQMTFSTHDVLVSSATQDENSVLTSDPSMMQLGSSNSISGIDYMQILGSLQLPMDSLQNIQIANLDVNGLQTDDLLQSFIFVDPTTNGDNATGTVVEKGETVNSLLPLASSTNYGEYGSTNDDVDSNTRMLPVIVNSFTQEKNLLLENVGVNSIGSAEMNCFSNNTNPIGDSDPFLTVASEQTSMISNISFDGHSNGKNNMMDESKVTQDCKQLGTTVSKQCPDCGRMFSKPSQMLRHRRMHTGEKPHVCTICHNTFTQKSSLDTHVITHSDIRPFKCSLCPFQTVHKAALKKHSTRAHPQLILNNLSEKLDGGNTPIISIVNSPNRYGSSGATVTTTQINITTGVRENV